MPRFMPIGPRTPAVYYVTESYTDSDGKSQTRQVQKTRGPELGGSIEHFLKTNSFQPRAGLTRNCCEKSSHSLPRLI